MLKQHRNSATLASHSMLDHIFHNVMLVIARILSVIYLLACPVILFIVFTDESKQLDTNEYSFDNLEPQNDSIYTFDNIVILSQYAEYGTDQEILSYLYLIAQLKQDDTIVLASLRIHPEERDYFEQKRQAFFQQNTSAEDFTTPICAFADRIESLEPDLQQYYAEAAELVYSKNSTYKIEISDLSCTYAFRTVGDYAAYLQERKENSWIGIGISAASLVIGIALAVWGFRHKIDKEYDPNKGRLPE